MTPLLSSWKEKTEKLAELQDWLSRAIKEVNKAPPSDPRWSVYREVEDAAQALSKELEGIEKTQEEALAEHLRRTGPVTFTTESGTTRTVSAERNTAGGPADLLPGELLAIWRVAAVFAGSVVSDGTPNRLKFGDAEQIAKYKTKKKGR